MEQLVLKFILIFLLKKCQVNSPLMGSIRTAAGTAAGSGPGTATTFCLLVQCFPPPLLEQQQKKNHASFCPWARATSSTTRWLKPWLPWQKRGASNHSSPLRMPCGQRGETSSLQGRKSLWGHARGENPHCV